MTPEEEELLRAIRAASWEMQEFARSIQAWNRRTTHRLIKTRCVFGIIMAMVSGYTAGLLMFLALHPVSYTHIIISGLLGGAFIYLGAWLC